jgi:subtilisin family serine protease
MKREYRANGRQITLDADPTVVAVRFREPAPKSMRAAIATQHALGPFADRTELAKEKYTLIPLGANAPNGLRSTLEALNARDEVARAAPVFLRDGTKMVATDRVHVGFRAGATNAKGTLKQRGLEILDEQDDEFTVRLGEYEDPFVVSEQLAQLPNVEYAEPDFVLIGRRTPRANGLLSHAGGALDHQSKGSEAPVGELALLSPAAKQYALTLTGALAAHALKLGDATIGIAIIDEGVDVDHPDLRSAIVACYDATDDDEFQEPNDTDAHGTACAGLAVGRGVLGSGVLGVGTGCSLLPVRIAYGAPDDQWVTCNWWIARGIDWAWKHGASVLSNSWGGGIPSTRVANALKRARERGRNGRGAVVVVAAGNSSAAVEFPANVGNVVAVSASNPADQPKTQTSGDHETWWGTCFGKEVTIAAPGVFNFTSDLTGKAGYNATDGDAGNYVSNFNGTSSAAPMVAGAIGLMLSANPDLTDDEVRAILCRTAAKVGSLPYIDGRNDFMGFGRLDVLRAVEEALSMGHIQQSEP